MKGRRVAKFERVLNTSLPRADARWSDAASDPNDAVALAYRARTLRAAWRSPVADCLEFLIERCRGKSILDIGCVAHDIGRMKSSDWLHGRLAAVAEQCLGLDVLQEGVDEMRRMGFDAVAHDLSLGPGPVADRAPFDVIVAGELIEHLGSIDMLFDSAAALLSPGGSLIITTPNPYAPDRVRAGQRGYVWENADHILYAFPSGIAELAERHGLVLAEAACTTDARSRRTAKEFLKDLRRWLRGDQWTPLGITSLGAPGVRHISPWRLGRIFDRFNPNPRFLGETFIYVVQPGMTVGTPL